MAYSLETDMNLGDLPWPSFMSKAQHMQQITDEIDSYIGFIYETPVDVTDQGPTERPARLLLKRISISLSTGRAMLTLAAPGEDDRLHALGNRLVTEALESLRAIATGSIILEGAAKIHEEQTQGPLQYNEDSYSNTDAFYDRFTRNSGFVSGGRV